MEERMRRTLALALTAPASTRRPTAPADPRRQGSAHRIHSPAGRACCALCAAVLLGGCGEGDGPVDPRRLTPTAAPSLSTTQVGTALNGEAAGDELGSSLAISANGSRIIAGAPVNDGSGTSAGHVRVYQLSAGTYTQLGADVDGEAADDRSGTSVAISATGSRIAVGAYLNDGAGTSSGHVRIFDLVGSTWTQVGADINGAATNRGAGFSVAISGSGSRVAVGAPGVSTEAGELRVYELSGGVWTQLGATITNGDDFTHSISMSSDGSRIAVSAPYDDINGSATGTTRVYAWNGTAWTQLGASIIGEAAGDQSGISVSLSGDGTTLAIGAPYNDGGGSNVGHVRVYRFSGGSWTQLGADVDGSLVGSQGDRLGSSVALSSDGTRLIAGGPLNSVARIYSLVGTTWTMLGTPLGGARRTGESVAMSADGLTAATGASYGDGNGLASGQVRAYALPAQ
jgi:WD40 repeat protein